LAHPTQEEEKEGGKTELIKKDIVLGGKEEVDDEGNVVEKNFRMTCNVSRGEGWSAGRINDLSCVGISC